MTRTPQLWTKFYEALAFLFYSLCSCDGKIRKEESEMVKTLLKEVWLDFEPSLDEYGYDAAYQVEAVFDWLFDMGPTAASAFRKFSAFVKDHPAFVDKNLAEKILGSANRLIAAYAGKNKTELGYLYQLEGLLKEQLA